jgi:MFS family permease
LNNSIFRKRAEDRARKENQALKDQQFVIQVIQNPELLKTAEEKVLAKDLISLEATDQDPRALYKAALALLKSNQPITPDAVLAALDKDAADWSAQTPEERQRRAEYLAVAPDEEMSVEEHVERISKRQKEIGGKVGWYVSLTSMLFNVGAFFGIYSFSLVAVRIGRRPTFAVFFFLAMVATVIAFLFMNSLTDALWMVPLMGFFQLSVFGGYAIYFPELFPTHLRSTGVSFCYNVGRYVAALGPLGLGFLTDTVYKHTAEPMRYAGVTMCACFLIGIVTLLFAPETKDQPLPE